MGQMLSLSTFSVLKLISKPKQTMNKIKNITTIFKTVVSLHFPKSQVMKHVIRRLGPGTVG